VRIRFEDMRYMYIETFKKHWYYCAGSVMVWIWRVHCKFCFIRFWAVISLYFASYYMKETAFCFVSLQQQRPDLPRLLVSTATVDDSLSFCLSVSLSPHGMLRTCMSVACSGWFVFTWWWLLLWLWCAAVKGHILFFFFNLRVTELFKHLCQSCISVYVTPGSLKL